MGNYSSQAGESGGLVANVYGLRKKAGIGRRAQGKTEWLKAKGEKEWHTAKRRTPQLAKVIIFGLAMYC
jgi:hypothetical protein